MVPSRNEGMYLGGGNNSNMETDQPAVYETVLQVDDEVGQLAHQDGLQIMMISTKDGIKEKGKAVQIKKVFSTSRTSLEENSPTSSVDPWTRILTRASLNQIRLCMQGF